MIWLVVQKKIDNKREVKSGRIYEYVLWNYQHCYGLNIFCTPPTLYLALIRLMCLCLCLFMSVCVCVCVFVCVCLYLCLCLSVCASNLMSVVCIIAYLTHIALMNLLLQFTATFPSPLTEGPSQSKN